MQTLSIYRGGQELTRIPLGLEPVEIGSAPACDLVVPDPGLAPRAWLAQARQGTVWLHDLADAQEGPHVLSPDAPWPLSQAYCLVRRAGEGLDERLTQPLGGARTPDRRWRVLVGTTPGARRVQVEEAPLEVGSDSDAGLRLFDPTVSARHVRLEPAGPYLVIRDLDSRNGTFVDGLRVDRARIGGAALLRVGRTDLLLTPLQDEMPHKARAPVAVASSMQRVIAQAERFARLPWPVLVRGESGAGKEEVAGLLHRHSGRAEGPFVALNAGGLAEQLVESELFGHERGAFTGAAGMHRGVFEQAHGGTLFLDEIGELPLALQARLLRVLETWSVRRVGGEQSVDVDVRLVCATHRDLLEMVKQGSFRHDLYYRLARLVLAVPALRERPTDLEPLARRFLSDVAGQVGSRSLSDCAVAALHEHAWPGNARELRNVLCAAAAESGAAELQRHDIEAAVARLSGAPVCQAEQEGNLHQRVAHYGSIAKAARAMGIPRTTLRDRLRKEEAS